MGIAASQARYLYLTARQTNVEFEGQQINQARTSLANEQASLYQEMQDIDLPTVQTEYAVQQKITKWASQTPAGPHASDYANGENDPEYQKDMSLWIASEEGTDVNAAYSVAVTQYESDKTEYDKAMDEINAKSEQIHQQDQVLELQLRQLDTEQETIVTELESVKKVIDKNIDIVFKTFQD